MLFNQTRVPKASLDDALVAAGCHRRYGAASKFDRNCELSHNGFVRSINLDAEVCITIG
jgi:hypothetical protein